MVEQRYYQIKQYAAVKNQDLSKKQEAIIKGILSHLGLKTTLNKIPLLGDIFFWLHLSIRMK